MNATWTEAARLLSVNTIAFHAFGYPMSFVELFGTLFNLWSVWLVARNRILTWPIGIVGVLLFLALFYQIRLYADTFEQVYYLFASIYGWWIWARLGGDGLDDGGRIAFSSGRGVATGVDVTVALSAALGYVTARLDLWLHALFPAPASFAYLDALTTIMSFTATLLMARKRVECWFYWICVDVIGIGLYYAKDVQFVALLYVVFLALALHGLRSWLNVQRADARRRAGRRQAGWGWSAVD